MKSLSRRYYQDKDGLRIDPVIFDLAKYVNEAVSRVECGYEINFDPVLMLCKLTHLENQLCSIFKMFEKINLIQFWYSMQSKYWKWIRNHFACKFNTKIGLLQTQYWIKINTPSFDTKMYFFLFLAPFKFFMVLSHFDDG